MDKPVYTQRESDARVRRALQRERERRDLIVAGAEPQRHRITEAVLSAPGLLAAFKIVPGEFYDREGGTAVLTCPCGWESPDIGAPPQARLEPGELYECPGCLRVYLLARELRAAAGADAPGFAHCHTDQQPCLPPCPEYA